MTTGPVIQIPSQSAYQPSVDSEEDKVFHSGLTNLKRQDTIFSIT